MNKTQLFFISLLSSHLNNNVAESLAEVNWSELYSLANKHNLTAIIALELQKLPKEFQPPKKALSYFNQALGLSIQNYEFKQDGIEIMKDVLTKNKIKHTIIKGAALRELYPVPSVRTSGDTDVVVEQDNLYLVMDILKEQGFKLQTKQANQIVLTYNDQEFQFKTYFDSISKDVYTDEMSETTNGYTCYLKPLYHLEYIINHALKHIVSGGFGFRQLMDVDVLIRSCEIDFDKLLSIFDEQGHTKSASVILAVTKALFNTPFDFDYYVDDELFDKFIDMIMTGGVFGYGNATAGTVRLSKTNSKAKAIASMFTPSKEYLYNSYLYANKHHYLLPIAYCDRLFSAVFKRGKKNIKDIKSIVNDDFALTLTDIKNELEI